MPRTSIPNAGFLAAADSLLLPFLAPRVFTEAPFVRKTVPNANGRITQKETETEAKRCDGKDEKTADAARASKGRNVHCAPPKLLYSAGTGARASNSAMKTRYADISAFARAQSRYYSTDIPDGDIAKSAGNALAKAHKAARRRSKPSISRTSRQAISGSDKPISDQSSVEKTSGSLPHRTARRTRHKVGKTISHATPKRIMKKRNARTSSLALMKKRRLKMLESLRRAIKNYRNHTSLDRNWILKRDGRYRSLARQAVGLSLEKPTVIDLSVGAKWLKTPHGRLRAFLFFDYIAYRRLKRRQVLIKLRHDARCPLWTVKLLENVGPGNEEQILDNWMRFDEKTRREVWRPLLLYLLHRHPRKSLYFIQLLISQPGVKRVEPDLIADALDYLSKLYKIKSNKQLDLDEIQDSLVPTLVHFMLREYKTPAVVRHVCTQELLCNIARSSNIDDLKVFFDVLEEKKVYLLFDTLLHYANTFARAGETEYALRCLAAIKLRIKDKKRQVLIANLQRFKWTCTLLLRKSARSEDAYHETTELVSALVDLGVKLDIDIYNAIMHNAMDAGDFSTAFKIFNSLEDNGLKPNQQTHAILLHGCATTSKPHEFAEFAGYCARIANETRDSWLATEYLYYLYVCHHSEAQQDPARNFSTIIQAYTQYFGDSVLRIFGIPIPDATSTEFTPLIPSPMAVYIVLQTQIQHAAASGDNDVWYLYVHFCELVLKDAHSTLSTLAKTPIIWNAFLLAFTSKRQFKYASQLIKDMTDHNPQPNVYSWNIFMHGFFRYGQVAAAERVFEIMRARNIEPDQFSWGTLLHGYTKLQHIEKIGDVISWVDEENQMDPQLAAALGRINDRARLIASLEGGRHTREERLRLLEEEKQGKMEERFRKVLTGPEELPIRRLVRRRRQKPLSETYD